ncbi:hypothetical protein ACQ4PT_002663 [Festuca glaucescens]
MAHSRTQHWAMAPPYHNRGSPPQQEQAGPAAEDESGAGSVGNQPRSLWIGGLLNWMDEEYLYRCFTRSSELVSVVVKHNKETRQPEGFGYLNFADHATADQILQSYNGQKMPNTDRDFRLSWVIRSAPEKPAGDDHAIYVGDLSLDVTDFMLHDVFKNRYPSVKKATVIWDGFSGHSKGYGMKRMMSTMDIPKVRVLIMAALLGIPTCMVTKAVEDMHITNRSNHNRPQYR